MDKIFYMKRRTKGAISVFLILIFVATYMLAALLVDGGRYRMAQVMAESALDSANQSVLSYYNQMLYDLYGLMAVDTKSISEEQIAEVLEDYVSKVLMTAEIEDDAYVSTLTRFLLDGEIWADNDVDYFDDYDFTITFGEGSAGSSVTLASTDYVEDQIVDYMKYRAPLELAGVDGLLAKLQAITSMGEGLEAAQALIDATNDNKSLFRRGDALQKDIDSFVKKVISFCNDTNGALSDTSYQLYVTENLMTAYGEGFHGVIDDIDSMEPESVPTTENGVPLSSAEIAQREQAAEAALEEEKKARYEEAKNDLLNSDLADLFSRAESLKQEAQELLNRIDGINGEYKTYISSLQSSIDSHSGSKEYEAVFQPEISAAQSQCGEIIRGVIPLLATAGILDKLLTEDRGTLQSDFSGMSPGEPGEIKSAADTFFGSAQEKLEELCEEASSFCDNHGQPDTSKKVDEGDMDINSDPEVKPEEKEEKDTDPRGFDEEGDLEVAYTQADTGSFEDLLNSLKLDSDDSGKVDQKQLFTAGLNLVSSLTAMMGEGVRDSIYVNEYAMLTFPNIVDDRNFSESSATQLQLTRHNYNATNAGVEYILVGKPDAEANVNGVKVRLLGTRTIFNTVAIFTDSAKRNQATALASAIPTPLTPVLTVVILIAWAVAESVLDVVDLMNGDSVPLFKTGGEWTLSIEGALNKCVDMVVDKAGDVVNDALQSFHAQLENTANEAIYKVYNGTYSTVDSAVSAFRDGVTGLISDATENVSKDVLGDINNHFSDAANMLKDQAMSQVEAWGGQVRDQAIKVVGDSLDQAFNEVSESINIDGMSDRVKDELKGKIGDCLEASDIMDGVDGLGSSGMAVLDMTYGDYLRIFLLMMNQNTKVQRIQSLIQANMRYGDRKNGGSGSFTMEESAVAIWADMDCEIRYLFMTNSILPDDVKRQGRMTFTVHSAASY